MKKTKKSTPMSAMIAILFGGAEIMKQGFSDEGNCWFMAIAVIALCWGIRKVRRTACT